MKTTPIQPSKVGNTDFINWLRLWTAAGAPCYTFPDGTTVYFTDEKKLLSLYKKHKDKVSLPGQTDPVQPKENNCE